MCVGGWVREIFEKGVEKAETREKCALFSLLVKMSDGWGCKVLGCFVGPGGRSKVKSSNILRVCGRRNPPHGMA